MAGTCCGCPIQNQGAPTEHHQHDRFPCRSHRFQQLLLVSGEVKLGSRARFAGHQTGIFAKGKYYNVRLLCSCHSVRETLV